MPEVGKRHAQPGLHPRWIEVLEVIPAAKPDPADGSNSSSGSVPRFIANEVHGEYDVCHTANLR